MQGVGKQADSVEYTGKTTEGTDAVLLFAVDIDRRKVQLAFDVDSACALGLKVDSICAAGLSAD